MTRHMVSLEKMATTNTWKSIYSLYININLLEHIIKTDNHNEKDNKN